MNTNIKRFYKNVQLITYDIKGNISYSDENLFPDWKENKNIFDCHPFFEISKTLNHNNQEEEYNFPCVHLNERICDVNFFISKDSVNITIFDYSRAYYDLNKISQERNESLIKNQEIAFSNKILLEKEAFKNELISNINHEITTPLSAIQGFIELLKKTDINYEQEELINIIDKESVHLKRIFNDMVDLSKIELGTFNLFEENFDLGELLNSISSTFKYAAENNALEFSSEFDPKLNNDMFGDKTRIYQIVNNLLNNAIKYTEGGFIKLEVKRTSGKGNKQHILITVQDSGIGIAKENQESIFDAFTQFGKSGEGSGLGLHVVKKLVSLMGGEITVDSELEKGTTFKVKLALKHGKEVYENSPKPKIELKKGKKYRVLVVENKLSTQYLIMKFLLNTGSFFIDTVSSAEEAIRVIENRKYDLIILDIKLDGMDGFQFAKKVRKNYADDFIKEVPIIAISAINNPNIKNICAANGIDSFIQKPFTQDTLLEKVSKYITKKDND